MEEGIAKLIESMKMILKLDQIDQSINICIIQDGVVVPRRRNNACPLKILRTFLENKLLLFFSCWSAIFGPPGVYPHSRRGPALRDDKGQRFLSPSPSAPSVSDFGRPTAFYLPGVAIPI
jgi:hypothetical protein